MLRLAPNDLTLEMTGIWSKSGEVNFSTSAVGTGLTMSSVLFYEIFISSQRRGPKVIIMCAQLAANVGPSKYQCYHVDDYWDDRMTE